MPDPKPEPKPNPKPSDEDIHSPKKDDTNFDRDGRERYPNEQSDQKQTSAAVRK